MFVHALNTVFISSKQYAYCAFNQINTHAHVLKNTE